MALKKSQLYSSLWASCDELRGGMDASQYKDYVLVLLFVKYVSDRYAGQPYAAITIPPGASFADMVALKGKPDIGDQINKKILGPLAQANKLADMPDFNDPAKLGSGKEMVDRLTNLVAIFENPALDFSKNRADGDDLLGDAYEYLMRHFATESGKSKGQFYTPAEVSRVIAQLLGVRRASATAQTTVYDPTCGSGSLLLKVAEAAAHGRDVQVTLYGQEKDNATAGLARMNMILHDYATAEIRQGNTLVSPLFLLHATSLPTYLDRQHVPVKLHVYQSICYRVRPYRRCESGEAPQCTGARGSKRRSDRTGDQCAREYHGKLYRLSTGQHPDVATIGTEHAPSHPEGARMGRRRPCGCGRSGARAVAARDPVQHLHVH